MNFNRRQPHRSRPGFAGRRILFLAVIAALLPLGAALPLPAFSAGAGEAGRLHADLTRAGKLAGRGLRPPTQRLARELPEEATELSALREPAGTAEDQIGIALAELREMSGVASLDPHYLPALVAAGRAFVAASGQDPVTRTALNPDYSGLKAELAASEGRVGGSAEDARKLSTRLERLRRALAHAKRRARRVEREVSRLRRGG